MLVDPAVPSSMRATLRDQLPAYALGAVAADARVGSGAKRSLTHFYDYMDDAINQPWREMIRQYPQLLTPHDAMHRAFVASYVAHLTVDAMWSRWMVRPHFAHREWAGRRERFFMLHILLTYMDERDQDQIEQRMVDALCEAAPLGWLDFISDETLCDWRNLISMQLAPNAPSKTLLIFSERIDRSEAEMRALLDDEQAMRRRLWQYISPAFLERVEQDAYRLARQQMVNYLWA
jgi:hypothetical protein